MVANQNKVVDKWKETTINNMAVLTVLKHLGRATIVINFSEIKEGDIISIPAGNEKGSFWGKYIAQGPARFSLDLPEGTMEVGIKKDID
jgi:hypothetical protein